MKTIKKLLALTLVLCMVFCLSVAVFAEGEGGTTPTEPTTPGTNTYKDMETVTITKTYNLTNAGTTSPKETFSFSALTCESVTDAGVGVTKESAPVPTISSIEYTLGEAGSANAKKTATITLPTYTAVGKYTYTFSEVDGKTAGVTYRADAIKLVVTVIEQGGKIRVATVHTEDANASGKSSEFDNTYSAGSLSVKKTVTGILGDTKKEFDVKVTFTAPTGKTVKSDISYVVGEETKTISAGEGWTDSKEVTIKLKHDQTITFTNIPYGVTYKVEEDADSATGYNVSYTNKVGEADATVGSEDTMENANHYVTITNDKGGEVDTGITLDSLPYILALAVAFGGAVVLFTRKRHVED